MVGYEQDRREAAKDIKESGKLVTIRHIPAVASGWTYSYDPVLGDTWTLNVEPFTVTHTEPPSTYTDYETYAIEMQYDIHDIDGTIIQSGDRKFMVSAIDTSGAVIPLFSTADKFILGSGGLFYDGSWAPDGSQLPDGQDGRIPGLSIVKVSPFQPGDVVIYYEVQARA